MTLLTMDDTTERAFYYLRCTACRHEFASHDRNKVCPVCKAPSVVRGLAVNRVKRKD